MQKVLLYTPEDVRNFLREALAIVDELAPPDDLRLSCFDHAARMVAHVTLIQPQPVQALPSLAQLQGKRGH